MPCDPHSCPAPDFLVWQKWKLGWLDSDTGVLIYQIDSAINSGSGPVRIIDAHPASTVCGGPFNDVTFDLGTGEVSSYSAAGPRFDLLARTTAGGYTIRVNRA
ncbi:MAG TPA: hypothetical protein VFV67_08440 [Actinophytocola sp.]|uniref:hypothetical protein n=1 Tax=Actinophytocola sp. TaxID=1872138 RepID=UPI002DB631B4|nr:hypothetical protein [Actinophytocola sp.]HEU5470668.1 hypothetical protein [Actinophytocola sp.]